MLTDFNLGQMAGATFDVMPTPAETVEVTVPEVIDNDHFFDFEKAKVQSLTLEQLRRTMKENDGETGVPLHGIYHFMLIDEIAKMCQEVGYETEIYDMFATNNKDKQTPGVSLYPELEQKYGIRAVEAHSIRRLFTNIRIKDFDTDELTTNLAVSYTQKGIQIGIGRNVRICHNQCMLSAERYVADFNIGEFKAGRLSPAELLDKVRSWLFDLRGIVREDDETIERLKDTHITTGQVLLIIGLLTAARVRHDTNIKAIRQKNANVYPLNQAQIGRFTEKMLLTQHEQGEITAWSMYNAATDLYKPQTAEQTLILPQNMSFVNFMVQQGILR